MEEELESGELVTEFDCIEERSFRVGYTPFSAIDLVLSAIEPGQLVSDMRRTEVSFNLPLVLSDEDREDFFEIISYNIQDWPNPEHHRWFIDYALERTLLLLTSMHQRSHNKVYVHVQMSKRPLFMESDADSEDEDPMDVYEDSLEETEEPTGSCSVCLDDLRDGDGDGEVVSLPCRHIFHRHCINKWLRTSASCPNCRFHLQLKC